MSIEVQISGALREYSGGCSEVFVSAPTVRGALAELKTNHRSLYIGVCDETGAVRRHVNLFVNSDLVCVRDQAGLDAPLKSGDVLTIWQAVSGG
jgi:molybdopterin converting factor small subunit